MLYNTTAKKRKKKNTYDHPLNSSGLTSAEVYKIDSAIQHTAPCTETRVYNKTYIVSNEFLPYTSKIVPTPRRQDTPKKKHVNEHEQRAHGTHVHLRRNRRCLPPVHDIVHER